MTAEQIRESWVAAAIFILLYGILFLLRYVSGSKARVRRLAANILAKDSA